MYSVPPGELPPRPPQACFGRAEFIEKIVGLAKNFTSVALIGTGGIGKTFIALAVLHHRHIKQRFGDNRWFIDCNQFPASRTHFLRRLSAVIGAGVRNPENIAPLRPFLSSRELFVVLDNAESILDPRGMDTQEIYAMVEELGQFRNICLCITSRVSTIPPDCKMLDVPTLSMEAACNAFYCTHETGEQSSLVNNILQQLNFHPLSISLLAKVAYHNTWGYKQLSQEWNAQCTQVLLTGSNGGLEKVIKLLFTSLAFRKLGPNACDLLSVIAFFPQGINENNLDWLFPTIPRRKDIFDKFCALSLTYQGNGFIRMLAPLRDYFFPKDPRSSPLLYITKERYFNRLSVHIEPGKPGFKEAQWISTEDVNIEYLLDVFTSVDTNSVSVWHACACFMEHLYWYKPQHLMMGPKIEELPDDHPSKPECLFHLSQLFGLLGNPVESKWLLTCTLKLWREQDNDYCIAQTLVHLSNVSWRLGLHIEGVYQVEEALGIYRQLNNTLGQAQALQHLARLLHGDNQLDAAEEAALQAIALLPDEGEQSIACQCNHTLGSIYLSKGETEAAMTYFETAIKIASSFNWDDQLFWIHCSLAELFSKQGRLSNAYNHIEYAKLHAINDTYLLGHAMELQAGFSYHQNRFEEAKSEALCASTIFEDSGAVVDAERCREILQNIEGKIKGLATSSVIDPNCELLEVVLSPIHINSPFTANGTEG